MSDEPFRLSNDPPPRRPWRGKQPSPVRQKLLLSGLDCLPGQLDLFTGRQGRQPMGATAPPARSALPLVAGLCEKVHDV